MRKKKKGRQMNDGLSLNPDEGNLIILKVLYL